MRMRYRELFAALSLAAAVGCGKVSDNGNAPDAPPDAPDTAPPMIFSSHPANNEKGVSPIKPVSIIFDEPLDPATVPTSIIGTYAVKPSIVDTYWNALFENFGTVEGTATYVADEKKLVFTPSMPLPANAHVDLTISSLKDVSGNMIAPTHLTFDTIINAGRYFTDYSGASIGDYYTFPLMNGVPQSFDYYYTMGTDGVWFTADDQQSESFKATYDAQGRMTRLDYFTAGPNGIFGDSDDTEMNAFTYSVDAQGRFTGFTTYNAPGTDGAWGTADDVILRNLVVTWTGDNFVGTVTYTNPGTDGVWKTADDRVSSATQTSFKYSYDPGTQHRVRWIFYRCGPDLVCGSPDDTVFFYYDVTTDTHGFITQQVRKTLGGNNIPFDSDDAVQYYEKFERDPSGRLLADRQYGAGTDTMFFTADDVVTSLIKYSYTAAGQATVTDYIGSGTDTIYDTADDIVTGFNEYKYDANGARTQFSYVYNAGPDGVYHTPDDMTSTQYTYDVAH